jgi:hypothetical protein
MHTWPISLPPEPDWMGSLAATADGISFCSQRLRPPQRTFGGARSLNPDLCA